MLREPFPSVPLSKLLGVNTIQTTHPPMEAEIEMQNASLTKNDQLSINDDNEVKEDKNIESDNHPFTTISLEIEQPPPSQNSWVKRNGILFLGFLFSQVGIILFNIGLTYGLVPLGQAAGKLLPTSFEHIDGVENSPRYNYGFGLFLILAFTFSLGILATLAEPALNVMGQKVEEISNGKFTRKTLVYCVAFGVGAGTAIGVLKIVLGIPIVYILITGYTIAYILTLFSHNDYVSIAWDSAGVTTGPVTVPFILSLGVNFGIALNTSDGFGILTCASVGPIVSVLAAHNGIKLYYYLFPHGLLGTKRNELKAYSNLNLAEGTSNAIETDASSNRLSLDIRPNEKEVV